MAIRPRTPLNTPANKVAVNENIKHLVEMASHDQEFVFDSKVSSEQMHKDGCLLEKPKMKLIRLPEAGDVPYFPETGITFEKTF